MHVLYQSILNTLPSLCPARIAPKLHSIVSNALHQSSYGSENIDSVIAFPHSSSLTFWRVSRFNFSFFLLIIAPALRNHADTAIQLRVFGFFFFLFFCLFVRVIHSPTIFTVLTRFPQGPISFMDPALRNP